MVKLAPVAVAPQTQPTELPPGPQQTEVEPEPEPEKPIEKVEIPREKQTEPLLSMTPPPKAAEKPKEKRPKESHASLISAPSTAEQQAERAAAPTPGASSRNPNAVPSWKSLLVSQLERSKRYPTEARRAARKVLPNSRSASTVTAASMTPVSCAVPVQRCSIAKRWQ